MTRTILCATCLFSVLICCVVAQDWTSYTGNTGSWTGSTGPDGHTGATGNRKPPPPSGPKPQCFLITNNTNTVHGLLQNPGYGDGTDVFYFGYTGNDVRECETLCSQEADCASFTLFRTTYVPTSYAGQCYGRSKSKSVSVTESRTTSGVRGTCISGINIRLRSSMNNPNNKTSMGRVEVSKLNSTIWGTVCDDSWDHIDATVTCRQLGYQMGVAYTNSYFGSGKGEILLDDVVCTGKESALSDCNHAKWGKHNCDHSEDAGVECRNATARVGTFNGKGEVVLIENSTIYQVCGNGFDDKAAKVACKQAGFKDGRTFQNIRYSGRKRASGSSPQSITNVNCTGNEASLFDCKVARQDFPCDKNSIAQAACFDKELTTDDTKMTVRFANNSDRYGQVEVRYQSAWVNLCFYAADDNVANAICREKGFNGGKIYPTSHADNSLPFWSPGIICKGTEKSFDACTFDSNVPQNVSTRCSSNVFLNVLCYNQGIKYRLVNKDGTASLKAGRVEIQYDGTWGTICDYSWSASDAKTLCKQLGYKDGNAYGNARYGRGTGPIWLSSLACKGQEATLLQCISKGWNISSPCTSHADDASVECVDDVRLVGGSSNYGRVQVLVNRLWRGVCGTGWDNRDANVTCRQLGFTQGKAFKNLLGSVFWHRYSSSLTNFNCNGEEDRLSKCTYDFNSYCYSRSSNYASVVCFNGSMADTKYIVTLDGGQIRFPMAGKVRLATRGRVGRICSIGWDDVDASIICRSLSGKNYKGGKAYQYNTYRAEEYVMTDVRCKGNETDIDQCPLGDAVRCNGYVAGVLCYRTSVQLRISMGGTKHMGLLEVGYDGEWGNICDSYFTSTDASVACKQMGYADGTSYSYTSRPPRSKIFMSGISCRGYEKTIFQCRNSGWRTTSYCSRYGYAGVQCSQAVRLKNGNTGSSTAYGQLEVYMHNYWGLVCGDGFDDTAALVACKQMGFNYGKAMGSGSYGYSSKRHWMNNVNCTGTERSLFNCSYDSTYCRNSNRNYATIICSQNPLSDTYAVSLYGNIPYTGRVRMRRFGIQGKICYRGWTDTAAKVVCKQLGYKSGVAFQYRSYSSRVHTWATSVNCTGQESHLKDCTVEDGYKIGCSKYSREAGVLCYQNTGLQFRLANGGKNYGRVEIRYDGRWGTVCDSYWSTYDARVFCRQMGYADGQIKRPSPYGTGVGPQYLSGLLCSGSEKSLLMCANYGWKTTRSRFCNDAGVMCQGSIRIGSSSGANSTGRVEVFKNGRWGQVCDDGWDDTDAGVMCRQLGFRGGKALCCSAFGLYYSRIYVTKIQCTGTESTLQECKNKTLADGSMFSQVDCPGRRYASVVCYNKDPATDVTFRITGNQEYSGRVEIKYAGHWGRICTNQWNNKSAQVLCKSKGYQGGVAYRSTTRGNGPYWIANITCQGSETSLMQCKMSAWGNATGCARYTDAGVLCYKSTGMQIRLVNGSSTSGRVEIGVDGQWGTICDSGWSEVDASVVCRQFGFKSGRAFPNAYFGRGSGPFWLRDVRCSGNEKSLLECGHPKIEPTATRTSTSWYTPQCTSHKDDAGVYCYKNVRLVGTKYFDYGRLQAYKTGTWYVVCDRNFNDDMAKLVCKEIGYNYGRYLCCNTLGNIYSSRGVEITEKCNTTGKKSIMECKHAVRTCSSTYASVICLRKAPVDKGFSVRIIGGDSLHGRLQVTVGGIIGRVCSKDWTDAAASAVCRSKGYKGGVGYQLNSRTTRPYVMGQVQCNGTETSLDQCTYVNLGGKHGCSYYDFDAGVLCYRGEGVDYRLNTVTGDKHSGRVEISYDGEWGTVCNNNWGSSDAKIFCRQLGLGYVDGSSRYISSRYRPSSSMPSYVNSLYCRGTEPTLLMCRNAGWRKVTYSCRYHYSDAGVYCYKGVRFHRTGNYGRVEIYRDNGWKVVCDRNWDFNDAGVVCRELGFTGGFPVCCGAFGYSYRTAAMDNVQCQGTESSLLNCTHTKPSRNCEYRNYASAVCYKGAKPTSYTVRLKGSESYTGRVQISFAGVDGRICADKWDDKDALVVCKQLGFTKGEAYNHYEASYSYLSTGGPYWTSDVQCTGQESRIGDCNKTEWGHVVSCKVRHSAGVLCYSDKGSYFRLAGGKDNYGRVEVSVNGEWGSICDTNWDDRDAKVFCRQLGYSDGKAMYRSKYGPGRGYIWLSSLQCTGNETALKDCPHSGWKTANTYYSCRNHNRDAGVYCYDYVRLVGGQNMSNGAVQIFHDGQWQGVCDQGFTDITARTVCQDLGHQDGRAACCSAFSNNWISRRYTFVGPTVSTYYRNYSYIFNYTMSCTGSENSTRYCDIRPGCEGEYYATAICSSTVPMDDTSYTFKVKLTYNNRGLYAGPVTVTHLGIPGGICPKFWDDNEAKVLCKMKGYAHGIAYFHQERYSRLKYPIWMNEINCTGTERTLVDCPFRNRSNIGDCSGISYEPGVLCFKAVHSVQFRITHGNNTKSKQGLVELQVGGVWGSICDGLWDNRDASVLCRQMGFPEGAAIGGSHFGRGKGPVWLSHLQCKGTETSLLKCAHRGWNNIISQYIYPTRPTPGRPGPYSGSTYNSGRYGPYPIYYSCKNHNNDAGVFCYENVRLQFGVNATFGGVYVYHKNKKRGLICDDIWTDMNSRVLCRQLGFVDGKALPKSAFGKLKDPIILKGVKCVGSEKSIADCPNGGWNTGICSSGFYGSVYCSNKTISDTGFKVRLMRDRYSSNYHGIVEVKLDGVWGRVCMNDWGKEEANVACRQLNFTGGVPYRHPSYTYMKKPILMSNVSCTGTEKSLDKCTYTKWGDQYKCRQSTYEAGVVCYKKELKFSLVGGTKSSGRVEVKRDGTVGTLCDFKWKNTAANVLCRQLGFVDGHARMNSYYGAGSGKVWLNSVRCYGSEASLLQCRNGGWDNVNPYETSCITHKQDVSVDCFKTPMVVREVRLVNGNKTTGRVELFVTGAEEWGTICNDFFDDNDATVLCHMLGYEKGKMLNTRSYGPGSGQIWLDDVRCNGSEKTIASCRHGGLGSHDCTHYEDVAITCSGHYTPPKVTSTTRATTSPSKQTTKSVTTPIMSTEASPPSTTTISPKTTASAKAKTSTKVTTPQKVKTSPKVTKSSTPAATPKATASPRKRGIPVTAVVIPVIVIIVIAAIIVAIVVFKWRTASKPRGGQYFDDQPMGGVSHTEETDLNTNLPQPMTSKVIAPDGSNQFSNKLYDIGAEAQIYEQLGRNGGHGGLNGVSSTAPSDVTHPEDVNITDSSILVRHEVPQPGAMQNGGITSPGGNENHSES